jgi:hypothetical protein
VPLATLASRAVLVPLIFPPTDRRRAAADMSVYRSRAAIEPVDESVIRPASHPLHLLRNECQRVWGNGPELKEEQDQNWSQLLGTRGEATEVNSKLSKTLY